MSEERITITESERRKRMARYVVMLRLAIAMRRKYMRLYRMGRATKADVEGVVQPIDTLAARYIARHGNSAQRALAVQFLTYEERRALRAERLSASSQAGV